MKNIIALFFVLLLFSTGCNEYLDVNENPNQPEDVQESLLLSPIEYNLVHNVTAGWSSIHVNHFMQVIALNQPVPNIGTYLMVPSDANDTWGYLYTSCFQNLKILNEKAEANGNMVYAGISKVLTAYALGYATDLWGDVPYSQAFQGAEEFRPAYDSQEEVYNAIQSLLDDAIANFSADGGLTPGGDDYFYSGDAATWQRVAYTLKARYYMHLTKAPGHTAAEQASLALEALAKGMQSNDDDLKFPYPGGAGTQNRWYINFLPIETIVMASQVVNTLETRSDPRLTTLVAPSNEAGIYKGRDIGSIGIGSLEEYSMGGDFLANADSYLYLLNYTESLFLKAEATLLTAGAAAAQPIYQEAIRQDLAKQGITDETAISDYLTARGTLTPANALQRIIEEKYIADIFSVENFNDWRRTGYPELEVVPNALFDQIPRRVLYPDSERSANPQPQQPATLTDRVWWDTE